MKMMRVFFLFLLSISLYSCGNTQIRKVENLASFAHTYGLVRWFYPSDEAQEIDWNQFALYGSSQVVGCRSAVDLKKNLEALFLPIAPGIFFSEQDTPSGQSFITPPDTTGMHLVAWQHYGVNLGLWSNIYVSKRINRPLQTRNVSKVAVYTYFPAEDYKGCELRMKARIKKTSLSNDFKIFLRLTDKDDAYVTFCADTTLTPIVNSGEWEEYERRLLVTTKSNASVYWGIYTEGEGSFCVEEILLEDITNGKTINTPLTNGTLSEDLKNPTIYDYTHTEREICIQTRNLLFEEHANFGDYKSQQLADGLYVHVPLALYGKKNYTYPESNRDALSKLESQVSKSAASIPNSIYMCSDVVVTWNVIKYFSPYLAELSLDWDNELVNALSKISFRDKLYHLRPLQLMMAKLEDAHVGIRDNTKNEKMNKYLPLRAKKIDNQIVVVDAVDPSFKNGDVILKINGNDTLKEYENFEELISGGKQWKSAFAAHQWWMHYNVASGTITMDVLRNNEKLTVKTNTVTPSEYGKLMGANHYKSTFKQSHWLNDNVLYLNITMSNFDEVKELLAERKQHQTVIIDARNDSRFLFRYMIPLLSPDTELKYNRKHKYITPKITYPKISVIEDTLSTLPQIAPNMKNIFLIGPDMISNYEDTLDNVRYNGLGYFVGTNTGGCSGRINVIYLPSGREVVFTGQKAMSEMGYGHYFYRTGIAPDAYVEETIEDIKNGRDAVLEKALEIIENGI